MKIYVDSDSYENSSYHDGEEWGEWSSDSSFEINSVHIHSRSGEEPIDIGSDVDIGDEVYILSMIYGQGDSFGHGSGLGEVLFGFKDIEVAVKAEKVWNESENFSSVTFLSDTGEEVTLSNPGSGYFENVESIALTAFIVE